MYIIRLEDIIGWEERREHVTRNLTNSELSVDVLTDVS
jgi:hypothetical protein